MMRWLATALLLVACGDRLHHGIDAPPRDAATDTLAPSEGEPPANAVKLVITRGGMPVVGAAVVFQDADSSLVHAALTNSMGVAWAELASGGFVTAIEHKGTNLDELTTFSAVQAGDALTLELSSTGDTNESPVTIAIPADTGASSYQLYTTCGGPFGGDPVTPVVALLVGCKGFADIVVVSRDETDQLLRAIYAANTPVPEPPATQLTVSGTYAALATTTFAYSNVPAPVTWVSTYHAFANARGRAFEQTAGDTPTAGAVVTSVRMPAATAMTLTATALFSTEVGAQIIYDSRATSTAYALDVGAALLPPYATQPVFDIASGTVTWTERTGAVQPDLVRARIHAYRDSIPTGRAWGWRIIAARAGAAIAFPRLPVLGFDFNVASGDVVGVDELTTAHVPGGYSAARRSGFADLAGLVIGTTERMVVQSLNVMEL